MTNPEFSLVNSLPLEMDTSSGPINLRSRNALARTLTPTYMHLNPENYSDITPRMVELAAPDRLRPDLIRDKKTEDDLEIICQVSDPPLPQHYVYVGVLPREYAMMKGSIETAGNRAAAITLNARMAIHQVASEEDLAAATRSRVHTVNNLLETMRNYRVNALGSSLYRIHRFQEAANYKGLARFGNEGNMRMELTALRQFTFDAMMQVIGLHRNWSETQRDLAQRTLEVRFFLLGDKRARVANFKSMLDLSEEWTKMKIAIIDTKIAEAKKILKDNGAAEILGTKK